MASKFCVRQGAKPQEYFAYFKVFATQAGAKFAARRARGFIQRFPRWVSQCIPNPHKAEKRLSSLPPEGEGFKGPGSLFAILRNLSALSGLITTDKMHILSHHTDFEIGKVFQKFINVRIDRCLSERFLSFH